MENEQKRILAIGDIHGCLNSLKALIEKIQLTQSDYLYITGDIVDRGPSIPQTVDYLIDLKNKYPKIRINLGNHDEMWIDYLNCNLRMSEMQTFMYNGGGTTINQYDEYLGRPKGHGFLRFEDLPQSHQDFYNSLEEIIVDEEHQVVFVHAGLRPGVSILEQTPKDVIWIRDTFLHNPYKWGDFTIVHGHTPMTVREARKYHEKMPSRFNVDNGCVFGYSLSCVDVLTGNVLSVVSQEKKNNDDWMA